VSALEFAAAIKWPVTVLILALMAAWLLKRTPEAGKSVARWADRRNFRVRVAGQELEASVADTQHSMDVAASTDVEVGRIAEETATPEQRAAEGANLSGPDARAVEAGRRAAVESVMRNATRLGYEWARTSTRPPLVDVSWNDDGHPSLQLHADPHALPRRNPRHEYRPQVPDTPQSRALIRRLRSITPENLERAFRDAARARSAHDEAPTDRGD
jgi:hypothetical protein